MTGQDVVDQVRSALLEPVAGFWANAELLGWINRAEADFNNRTHALEGRAQTGTQLGIPTYPLPNNCITIRAVMHNRSLIAQPATWQRVVPSNLERNLQQNASFLNSDTGSLGVPRKYMVWGRDLYLFPTPDITQADNLIMFYKAKPIPLSDLTKSLNLDPSFEDGVIAYVLWKAYEKEKETELAMAQQQTYEMYVKQGLRWQKMQSGDQRYRLDIPSPMGLDGGTSGIWDPLN